MIISKIKKLGIVPVVVAKDADEALSLAEKFLESGIDVMEITLRTPGALEAIAAVRRKFPQMIVGAGTVLTVEQCFAAHKSGAQFIVSPGMDPYLSDCCDLDVSLPYIPGCATATDIMAAIRRKHSFVKFFPAAALGGAQMLSALSSAFPDVTFMPTGGVREEDIPAYFALPCVAAIGGSWLTSGDVKENCAGALDKIREARK